MTSLAVATVGGITPPPRLVLFDLDDTLCDYATARTLRLRLAFSLDLGGDEDGLAKRDLDRMIADSLAMQPHGADHFPELFRRYGITDPATAEAAMAWYRTNRFHGLELFADAVATVRALREAADPPRTVGLITNGPADVQRAKIALLAVDGLVDFVVVSGELGIAKPDPRIFAEALRLGEAKPAEAVFVGDSPEYDMAGARAAGIRSVWLNRTGRPWPGGAPAPDHEIDSLPALLPLLGVATDASSR